MSLPSEIKAVVPTSLGKAEVKTVPLPKLRDDYILVRTTAVGLNPTDWKHVDGMRTGPAVLGTRVGCDYAGIVEAVGKDVTKPFKKGDRVCGFVHGSNQVQTEDGAFAEYIVAKGDLQITIPENLEDWQGATLGVGISTVCQGLYQALGLRKPWDQAASSDSRQQIFIYGGSTAMGILGIQYAVASGYRVATTCSPHNFEYVKSLGADAVFDYRSPTLVDDTRAWASDDESLTMAWDCVASTETAKICAAALSRTKNGHYRSLIPVPEEVVRDVNERVDAGFTWAYTAIGEAFEKGHPVPAVPQDYVEAREFWELSRGLLAEGRIKPAKADVNRGGKGLEGVLVGLKELKEGRVSGRKLVYTL